MATRGRPMSIVGLRDELLVELQSIQQERIRLRQKDGRLLLEEHRALRQLRDAMSNEPPALEMAS